jgi:beta-glucosidase
VTEAQYPAGSGLTDPRAIAGLLPSGFTIGAATAAIQIEGAADEDGRGRSTWDDFAERPGRILDGSTPRVTADHYHRMPEDVALLADLGVDAYRFSISWPRIQPEGTGPANPKGIAFYDRLLDALLEAGIRPTATLFHWDTPAPLEQRGGWLRRDTAERFAEFASIAGAAFGDRVADWVTINEAVTVMLDGYALGIHAPGRSRLFRAIPVARQLLRAHGLAVQALRAVPVLGRIGITNAHSPVSPASDSADDRAAAGVFDFLHNRLFADPVLLGTRPELPTGLPRVERLAIRRLSKISRADLKAIAQPLDFYGLNYYFPSRIAAGPDPSGASPDGNAAAMRSVPFHLAAWPEYPVTGFGWPAAPDQLVVLLDQLHARYGASLPPVEITEGGASYPDAVGDDGQVDDVERVEYLAAHLAAAAGSDVDVRGYYVWSLLDNWEWAAGFTQRFGLVHVDFDTLARTPKRSFTWLREVQRLRRGARSAEEGQVG